MLIYPQQSKTISEEIDFIDATHFLCVLPKNPADLLPIQIRLEEDKLALIKTILVLNPDLSSDLERLLDLTKKLTRGQNQTINGIRARCLASQAALTIKDLKLATRTGIEICREIKSTTLENHPNAYSDVLTMISALVGALPSQRASENLELLHLAIGFCKPCDIKRLLALQESFELPKRTEMDMDAFLEDGKNMHVDTLCTMKSANSGRFFDSAARFARDPNAFQLKMGSLQKSLLLNGGLGCADAQVWDTASLELIRLFQEINPMLSHGYRLNLRNVRL